MTCRTCAARSPARTSSSSSATSTATSHSAAQRLSEPACARHARGGIRITEREDELCRRSGALQGDELERVSRDLVELATTGGALMREDLDEYRLVGRDTIDIDTGAVLKTQRSRRKLDAQLLPDAGENQRLCEPLSCESLACPRVPAAGIRGIGSPGCCGDRGDRGMRGGRAPALALRPSTASRRRPSPAAPGYNLAARLE